MRHFVRGLSFVIVSAQYVFVTLIFFSLRVHDSTKYLCYHVRALDVGDKEQQGKYPP
jgi:hypothetical protein